MTGPTIIHLPEDEVDVAVRILSDAFHGDPILTFFLNEPNRRKEAFRVFFGNVVQTHLRFGHVYAAVVRGEIVGVAVWRPPNAKENHKDKINGTSVRKRVRILFPETSEEMFFGFEAARRLHPSVPHWYLFFVGVEPASQGLGIGSKLLSPVLRLADETGTLCYLETPFPRTIPFYENLGFGIPTKSNPFRGAPMLWTMTRKPTPSKGRVE